jgi:Transposase IS116/IS110/IS902 family
MEITGMGPSGAARLLAGVGDIHRFAARDKFASWNGNAPLDAFSGDQTRHRLSRAGNRRINRALLTSPSLQHAELVALRIRKHHPGHRSLPDVDATSTCSKESVDLGLLVVGPEVQVQPVLGLLRLRDLDKDQSGEPMRRGTDLELLCRVVQHNPAQGICPPSSERSWVT